MQEYMNEPIDQVWTDQDVMSEYQKYQDKRKVSRIFDITVKEINAILRRNLTIGHYIYIAPFLLRNKCDTKEEWCNINIMANGKIADLWEDE